MSVEATRNLVSELVVRFYVLFCGFYEIEHDDSLYYASPVPPQGEGGEISTEMKDLLIYSFYDFVSSFNLSNSSTP